MFTLHFGITIVSIWLIFLPFLALKRVFLKFVPGQHILVVT